MAKGILGVVENVVIIGENGEEERVRAIVDTGANMNSLDRGLAKRIGVGKSIRIMKVKNPSLKGHVKRLVVRVRIKIREETFDTEANIQDRSHMKFPVIIGRNLMMGRFMVDPEIGKEAVRRGQ